MKRGTVGVLLRAPLAPCSEIVELLGDHLEEALLPAGAAEVEAHLRECEGCTALLDELRATIGLLGPSTSSPTPANYVRTALGGAVPRPHAPLGAGRDPVRAAGAAVGQSGLPRERAGRRRRAGCSTRRARWLRDIGGARTPGVFCTWCSAATARSTTWCSAWSRQFTATRSSRRSRRTPRARRSGALGGRPRRRQPRPCAELQDERAVHPAAPQRHGGVVGGRGPLRRGGLTVLDPSARGTMNTALPRADDAAAIDLMARPSRCVTFLRTWLERSCSRWASYGPVRRSGTLLGRRVEATFAATREAYRAGEMRQVEAVAATPCSTSSGWRPSTSSSPTP